MAFKTSTFTSLKDFKERALNRLEEFNQYTFSKTVLRNIADERVTNHFIKEKVFNYFRDRGYECARDDEWLVIYDD